MSLAKDNAMHDSTSWELNPRLLRMMNGATRLEDEQKTNPGPTAFTTRFLVQATFPHSDPGTHYFERGTEWLKLSISAPPQIGIPYGSLPRLLLAWICTEAVKTQSPVIGLGRSQAAFLKKLGLHNDGRYISKLKDQTLRLVRSMISVTGSSSGAVKIENMIVAKQAFFFWDARAQDNEKWESTLTLSADFFEAIISAPVPLKMEALRSLRHSPLAMDIYVWLVYRMYTLRISRRREIKIPISSLRKQFGANYATDKQGARDFKKTFSKRLNEALLFYPEARNHVDIEHGYLTLSPAELHISPTKGSGKELTGKSYPREITPTSQI